MSPVVSVLDLVSLRMAPVQMDVSCGGWGTRAKRKSVRICYVRLVSHAKKLMCRPSVQFVVAYTFAEMRIKAKNSLTFIYIYSCEISLFHYQQSQ